jgi:periplasmic protein CpxP/Spy
VASHGFHRQGKAAPEFLASTLMEGVGPDSRSRSGGDHFTDDLCSPAYRPITVKGAASGRRWSLGSAVETIRRTTMNPSRFRFTHAAARAATVVAAVATMALAATPVFATRDAGQARVETRINEMHAKLKITAAEEEQWAKVAGVMRDNAKKMDELNSTRAANATTMNAVDDLKSYGAVVDAHADEIKRFAAAFEPLYAGMSDAQKAEADALFRHGASARKSKHGR